MAKRPQVVVLGTLGAPYGVHGWIRVNSATEDPQSIMEYQPWLVEDKSGWRQVEVDRWRSHSPHLIVKLKGVDDREVARRMGRLRVAIASAQLPLLTQGEYYWSDLIGCAVENSQGVNLGHVVGLMETGAHDVLRVRPATGDPYGSSERLIPMTIGIVIQMIDLGQAKIVVDWDPTF